MNISFMTVITINLSLSVLLIVLLPLLNCRFCLRNLGGRCLAACCIAVMLRALIPIEFPFSRTIPISRIVPSIRDIIMHPVGIEGFQTAIWQILLFVWLSVALFLTVRKLRAFYQLQKIVRRLPDCENRTVMKVWSDIREKYPSGDHVRVVCTRLNASPLITGLRHPVILLPEHEFSRPECRMILEHEMLHCIRHDIIIKMAADILCTFYWWNPLFYLLRRRIFELIEIGNDSLLTRDYTADEKADYMQCLADTARAICRHPVPFALSFGRADQKALRRRMDVIGFGKPSGKLRETTVIGALLLIVWCCTSFTLEPYAAPEGPYILMNQNNCYVIQNGSMYDIYYQDSYVYSTDSIEYFNSDVPVYQNGD